MRFLARLMLGFCLMLVITEIGLHLLPVSTPTQTGYHFSPTILTYPAHHVFTASTGWDLRNSRRHRSNNFGYLSEHDFVRNPTAIALIGDSYVEANMLPERDRLDMRLERLLPGRAVYALGGQGSSLLDYVERVRFASERFGIREFVIVIETGDVRQTLCGSGNIHAPCLLPNTFERVLRPQASAGWVKWVARHSALAQYLFSQLKFNPAALSANLAQAMRFGSGKGDAPERAPSVAHEFPIQSAERIITSFINALPRAADERYTLIFDRKLRSRRDLGTVQSDPIRDRFMVMAGQAGFQVIDLAPLFRAELLRSRLNLSMGPYDAHWNPHAHQIVAEAVAARISPRHP